MESQPEVMTNEERLKAVMLFKLEKIKRLYAILYRYFKSCYKKKRMCFPWPLQIQGVTPSRTDISICRVVIVKHKLGG